MKDDKVLYIEPLYTWPSWLNLTAEEIANLLVCDISHDWKTMNVRKFSEVFPDEEMK